MGTNYIFGLSHSYQSEVTQQAQIHPPKSQGLVVVNNVPTQSSARFHGKHDF